MPCNDKNDKICEKFQIFKNQVQNRHFCRKVRKEENDR